MNAPALSEPMPISKMRLQLPTQPHLKVWLCVEPLCISAQALLECEELFTSTLAWPLTIAIIITANISYTLMVYQAQP